MAQCGQLVDARLLLAAARPLLAARCSLLLLLLLDPVRVAAAVVLHTEIYIIFKISK